MPCIYGPAGHPRTSATKETPAHCTVPPGLAQSTVIPKGLSVYRQPRSHSTALRSPTSYRAPCVPEHSPTQKYIRTSHLPTGEHLTALSAKDSVLLEARGEINPTWTEVTDPAGLGSSVFSRCWCSGNKKTPDPSVFLGRRQPSPERTRMNE